MRNNTLISLLCSIPVILCAMYFVPFLGFILLVFRMFTVTGKKKRNTPIVLIVMGLLIFIPNILKSVFKMAKFDTKAIPYFNDIVNSSVYNTDFIKFAKYLLIVGVIFYILSFIFNRAFMNVRAKLGSFTRDYIQNEERRTDEIKQKNDLLMQEKREIANNSHVVKCPYCGSDNMLTGKTGTCKFCRRSIS